MATSAVRMLRPKPPCVRSHSHHRLTDRSTRDSAGCQSLWSSILALAWLIPTKSAMHFMTSDQWWGIVSSPSLWSRHGYSRPTDTAAVPHMAGTHQGEDMKIDPMRLRSNAERRYCTWKKSNIKLKKTPTQKRNETLHRRLLVAVMFVAGRMLAACRSHTTERETLLLASNDLWHPSAARDKSFGAGSQWRNGSERSPLSSGAIDKSHALTMGQQADASPRSRPRGARCTESVQRPRGWCPFTVGRGSVVYQLPLAGELHTRDVGCNST